MRRALVLAIAGAALWVAAPAGAIETATFGMEPHPKTTPSGARTSFRVELEPGAEASDEMRIWNKSNAPLKLKLSASTASLDEAGKVALGGNSGTGAWFTFAPQELQLEPKGSRVVRFTVHAPDQLDGGELAAAVTVEPVASNSSGVAVVQRLATMVYIDTIAGGASGAMPLDWKLLALAALTIVAAVGGIVTWRSRPNREDEPLPDGPLHESRGEEAKMNARERAATGEVEVGPVLVNVDDPAVDRLYQAIYPAASMAPAARPRLAVVNGATPTRDEPVEEFAWSVPPRRR